MGRRMNQKELEKRLKSMSDIYGNLGVAFDKAWELVPDFPGKKQKGEWIRDIILGDTELKNLMSSFERNRPPKFMLVGRTGVGKSSLINALCGTYRAQVSDSVIGTAETEIYEVKREEKTLLHILDTRGIAEGNAISAKRAEDELQKAVFDFQPDVILFLSPITARDDSVRNDVSEIKKLNQAYKRHRGVWIPVVSVLTRTDTVPPASERLAADYSPRKMQTIDENVRRYREDISKWGFQPEAVVPVSSYIDWGRSDKELNKLSPAEIETLVPKEDCRYNIEKLIDIITSCLPGDAAMGFCMAARLETVFERIARRIVDIFASIAAVVAAAPIPFADMPVLWGLEVAMVILIAAIGGETLDAKAAKKFLFSVLGIVGAGFAAQQFSRFFNAMVPFSGSVVGATIATGTMKLLGEMAIRRYIRNEEIGKIRKDAKQQIEEIGKIRKDAKQQIDDLRSMNS